MVPAVMLVSALKTGNIGIIKHEIKKSRVSKAST
jgi:hypothetical protein